MSPGLVSEHGGGLGYRCVDLDHLVEDVDVHLQWVGVGVGVNSALQWGGCCQCILHAGFRSDAGAPCMEENGTTRRSEGRGILTYLDLLT